MRQYTRCQPIKVEGRKPGLRIVQESDVVRMKYRVLPWQSLDQFLFYGIVLGLNRSAFIQDIGGYIGYRCRCFSTWVSIWTFVVSDVEYLSPDDQFVFSNLLVVFHTFLAESWRCQATWLYPCLFLDGRRVWSGRKSVIANEPVCMTKTVYIFLFVVSPVRRRRSDDFVCPLFWHSSC